MALPEIASWPYLIASVLIHLGYFTFVALAYRHGELSFAYPIMRGTAPAFSAVAAAILLNESPSPLWMVRRFADFFRSHCAIPGFLAFRVIADVFLIIRSFQCRRGRNVYNRGRAGGSVIGQFPELHGLAFLFDGRYCCTRGFLIPPRHGIPTILVESNRGNRGRDMHDQVIPGLRFGP